MIRTFTIALTVFTFCAPVLHADEQESTSSDKETIQQNENARQRPTASPPLFRAPGSQDESEFDIRLRDALTSTIDVESRQTIQKQLNGTWKYVAIIRTDSIESYDERDVQLVIHNDLCGVFEDGKLSGREPDRLRILTTSDPIAYIQASEQIQKIRFGIRVGTFFSYGLLRVDGDQLMMTSTPAVPKFDGYYGVPSPDFFDEVGLMSTALGKYIPYFFPNTCSPEGTRNRQVILRRVSDSTKLLDRVANLRPDGKEDPTRLTELLRRARVQEDWLKQAHLKIAAHVSSLNARAELAPHTDKTLQKAINNWREKYAGTNFTAPTAYQDLMEALAALPGHQLRGGYPLSVNLQAGKAVTRLGNEIIAVTDGDLSVYIDRQQGADTLFKRGDSIPHHQLSDFRFSSERIPEKATRSYTDGVESHPVGDAVVRVHLKNPRGRLWRPGENIPWVMTTRRDNVSRGQVPGAYQRNRRSIDSPRVRQSIPPAPPLPTPLPPPPPDLLTYQYNTQTKFVENYQDYAEYAPGELYRYRAFSFGEVKIEQSKGEEIPPVWFPRYFIEVYYQSGIPKEFIARRIDSVKREPDTELSTAVPAEAGATLIRIRKDDWPKQIKLKQNVHDVVAHVRQIMQAK